MESLEHHDLHQPQDSFLFLFLVIAQCLYASKSERMESKGLVFWHVTPCIVVYTVAEHWMSSTPSRTILIRMWATSPPPPILFVTAPLLRNDFLTVRPLVFHSRPSSRDKCEIYFKNQIFWMFSFASNVTLTNLWFWPQNRHLWLFSYVLRGHFVPTGNFSSTYKNYVILFDVITSLVSL
jgi:hypothetical protein